MTEYTVDYEIYVPHLKTVGNRRAGYNRLLGDITYHYSQRVLDRFGLYSVNFCFFILWNENKLDGELNREIWLKREISIKANKPINLASNIFDGKFYKNERRDSLARNIHFFHTHGLDCRYMLIKDLHENYELRENDNVAVQIDVEPNTGRLDKKSITLEEMNRLLIANSNGEFRNNKPLIWYETDLEHYLSQKSAGTGALFPGDCDMMLYDHCGKCRYIIEFKKCTSSGNIPVEDQSFLNYINKDRSKYIRLNILRKYFSASEGRSIPLLNIFYPTTEERIIKIEEITLEMTVGLTYILQIDGNAEANQERILSSIIQHFPLE